MVVAAFVCIHQTIYMSNVIEAKSSTTSMKTEVFAFDVMMNRMKIVLLACCRSDEESFFWFWFESLR